MQQLDRVDVFNWLLILTSRDFKQFVLVFVLHFKTKIITDTYQSSTRKEKPKSTNNPKVHCRCTEGEMDACGYWYFLLDFFRFVSIFSKNLESRENWCVFRACTLLCTKRTHYEHASISIISDGTCTIHSTYVKHRFRFISYLCMCKCVSQSPRKTLQRREK